MGKKVAPSLQDVCLFGWHLPSDGELYELINYLVSFHGPEAYAHPLTSKTGRVGDINGLDTYQISLKPGALWHEPTASHTNLVKRVAYFWPSRDDNEANGDFVGMDNGDKHIYISSIGKPQHALCLRCIRNK